MPLTDYQRRLAEHRIMFDHPLAPDLDEGLRRASLACAENGKKETDLIELFCALYLHYQREVSDHFIGDFRSLLSRTFPKHRYGDEGLIPDAMLEKITTDDEAGGFVYSVKHTDEVLRLLWLATALANGVGKRTSLKDVLDAHMNAAWPRRLEFQHDEALKPPFTLEVKTPSGGFQPVRTAQIKLNGKKVAEIAWPAAAMASAVVELDASNRIELELDGPTFGSIEFTIRGTSEALN